MSGSSRMSFSAAWLAIFLVAGLPAFPELASGLGTQGGTQFPSSAPISSSASVSGMVQPALTDVQSSLSRVNISHWKAPNEVRSAAQQDAASIQRDLTNTLPA